MMKALSSVISSEYPVFAPDAIKLAGLQCQVVCGDHVKNIHNAAFLT